METKTESAKIEQRLLIASLVCLLTMAIAWTGFYIWCRVNYPLKYYHYEVGPGSGIPAPGVRITVPLGAPDWVETGAQKMADLEALIRGERFPMFRFTMGDTF